jgi:hypothetical protein
MSLCQGDVILEYEYKKTNREEARSPKLGKSWCGTCDRALINESRKCPVCGAKPVQRRLKKETNS